MNLRQLLIKVSKGEISVDEAEKLIKLYGIEIIGEFAKYDIGREVRIGYPEIIFAEGKDPNHLKEIIKRVLDKSERVIVSRVTEKDYPIIEEFKKEYKVYSDEMRRIFVIKDKNYKIQKTGGKIGIIAAGTSDIPYAEEVKIIDQELGCDVYTSYDAGIASLKRFLDSLTKLISKDVDVIVAVAGMEGALPSVVRSLVDIPVIGLPLSIGYGYGGRGEAALMSMLQSCSAGLLVVNIDNTVGAALAAASIANRVAKFRETKTC